MEETLLQAENKFLKARIEYLELKLSTESKPWQECERPEHYENDFDWGYDTGYDYGYDDLLSKEYVDLFQLDIDKLKDLCKELGIHNGRPSYPKWKLVLRLHHKMDKVVEKVKEFKSRGLYKDVFICKLKDLYKS